jgi:DNA-binding CsgD family transcriptional regulator
MSFLWFGKKRDIEVSDEIKSSFENVKQDIDKISAWITHLHTQDNKHHTKIEQVYDEILKIKEDIDGIKSFISFFDSSISKGVFKHPSTGVYKQPAVLGVQTRVQTGVQTPNFNHFLRNLSSTERTIVWIVLNSELKLSCDDIAALLGKDRATVRGQLNSIKRKNESLILEHVEKNGKKRYYVDPRIKEGLLKQLKNKVKKKKSEAFFVQEEDSLGQEI